MSSRAFPKSNGAAPEQASCLLREAVGREGEESAETFATVLAEAAVEDTHWQLGNYEVLEAIGRGGMGVIYRARQRYSRRIVALKRVLAYQAESPEILVRFRREAEAVAKLDHPNILAIYEVGQSEDGLPFYSMKFASGGSLREAAPTLRDRPNDCARLMAKVARAIDYAHQHGILHRDLQPGNILLDENGEPLVSDFGLAKWLTESSDLTRTLTAFGTPGYIAPEQAESAAGDLTPASDIYSLGAILFHLLAGRPPFVGANALSVIHQAAAQPAPRLRTLLPTFDRDLETICARCLERDPKARYQTAGDLAEDLECWLEGRPILARPVYPPTRLWRWARRNPILAGAAAGCFLLGATVLWMLPNQIQPSLVLPISAKGIAVLPFENLSGGADNAVFTTGVQNEILTDLARVKDLKVISRSSVMQYKPDAQRNLREIARTLGVAHVVEGSVQRVAGKVRVNAQLIDARTGAYLWAQKYDRPVDDVFAIQSEIAQKIADQLHSRLSPAEKAAMAEQPTADLKAYHFYTEAEAIFVFDNWEGAEESLAEKADVLEKAIQRDPTFALAYCALAKTQLDLSFTAAHDAHLDSAKKAVDKALQLRPEMGEAHRELARYYLYKGDLNPARKESTIALRTLPNDSEAFRVAGEIAAKQGHWNDALTYLQKAHELDPRNEEVTYHLAVIYRKMRLYRPWEQLITKGFALHGGWAQLGFAEIKLDQGDLDAAQAILTRIPLDFSPTLEIWETRCTVALCRRDYAAANQILAAIPANYRDNPWTAWWAGLLARLSGDELKAKAIALPARKEMDAHWDGSAKEFLIASRLDAVLGRKEIAIEEAKRAVRLVPMTKDAELAPHVLPTSQKSM